MTDYTVTIYCFVDDFLKLSHPKADAWRKVSDAEIITTVILACRFFGSAVNLLIKTSNN